MDAVSDGEDTWEANRSSERLKLIEQVDFRTKLVNQSSIQPERVVYSTSGMHLSAARLTDHGAIADHVWYWGTAASAAEAHYLCAAPQRARDYPARTSHVVRQGRAPHRPVRLAADLAI